MKLWDAHTLAPVSADDALRRLVRAERMLARRQETDAALAAS